MKNYWVSTSYVEDKSFQRGIIKTINKSIDEGNSTTNVKAKMTSWHMHKEIGFSNLIPYILSKAELEFYERYGSNLKFSVCHIWGMCYKSNDFAIPHDHVPSYLSCVYYIDPPSNGPDLVFPEINEFIQPKDGMLILFPSWVVHEVPAKKFIGKRYTVSGNLIPILN